MTLIHDQFTRAKIKNKKFEKEEFEQLSYYTNQSTSPIVKLYEKRIQATSELSIDFFYSFYENYLRVFDQLPLREKQIFLLACINDAVILIRKESKSQIAVNEFV